MVVILVCACVIVQLLPFRASSQHLGIKTNALLSATTSANLGIEFKTAPKWTVELLGAYKPWVLGASERMFKYWAAQAEGRYWLCETFEGSFFGLHAQLGEFNMSGLRLPDFIFGSKSDQYRLQGTYLGVGISYGYQWILGNRWVLEANLGLGYNYIRYGRFLLDECGTYIGEFTSSPGYFGPTKMGISFMYLIR